MRRREIIFITVLLALAGPQAQAAENGESAAEKPAVEVRARGFAVQRNRSQSFHIGTIGNWGNVILNGREGRETPVHFNQDGWGGGYEIEGSRTAGPWAVALVYAQSFAKAKKVQSDLPGTGAALLSSMAFIDGGTHGPRDAHGFFISANPVAGRSSPGTATLKYESAYHDLYLPVRYRALDYRRGQLEISAGPAYAGFFEDYRFETAGSDAINGVLTSSATDEILEEHLFGGRSEIGARIFLSEKFSVSFGQRAGLFYRFSRLEAAQSVVNGSGNLGGGRTFTNLNERITTRTRDSGVVSQFESYITFRYAFTRRLAVSFFYQYDVWLGLTRIENPAVSVELRRLLNRGLSIEESQTLRSHSIGGEITLRF